MNVTVTITEFTELQAPDDTTDGDYYANVDFVCVGSQSSFDQHEDNEAHIFPNWTFTATVDPSICDIVISIYIYDHDDLDADDVMDINPKDGPVGIQLLVDPTDGSWRGLGFAPGEFDAINLGFSKGDGDEDFYEDGGQAGLIRFGVALNSDGDIDDDGIPDSVELLGMVDDDGNPVGWTDDPGGHPADPCRKTIAVEIDYMVAADHSHQPMGATIANLVKAFDAAPVAVVNPCPYAGFPDGSGVNLVIDVDQPLVETLDMDFGDFDASKPSLFSSARQQYYHYSMWVHNQDGSGSSGIGEVSGDDFMVSLGTFANQVGTVNQQTGTFMHELGHNLGLEHGGDEDTNCKPNYLSVMNYTFQMTGVPITAVDTTGDGIPDGTIKLNGQPFANRWDYSRQTLPTLDEDELVEGNGIGDSTDFTMWDFDGAKPLRVGRGDVPLDWDGSGAIDPGTVEADLNNIGKPDCGTDDDGDEDTTTGEELSGYTDWDNIQYVLRDTDEFGDGVFGLGHGPLHTDMAAPEASYFENAWLESFNPDLALTQTASLADANAGDTLTYTTAINNEGTGRATAVKLTNTFPDGVSVVRPLADLDPGHGTNETFNYVVPCLTADLTVLVNHAKVTSQDLQGLPEKNVTNNEAESATVVHTPIVELDKTGAGSVNAGEAISYAISYENVGSGNAAAVRIDDTLPADEYFSAALNLGAGPQPDAVTKQADETTTLTWKVGALPAGTGPKAIGYTARPSLLMLNGSSVSNHAVLTFSNANGCVYPAVTTSATTAITAVAPTQNPQGLGFWRTHGELWTSEILARVQATDDRFDGADTTTPNGALSTAEVQAVLAAGGNMDKVLQEQLLATYFNLATRRINAGTAIDSHTAASLGLVNVRDAAVFAMETLLLPVNSSTREHYTDATRVLDEINNDKSEIY